MTRARNLTNLDFMRSIAVLLVVGSHLLTYTQLLPLAGFSGITGVCLFFVHTSLVLMWSLERDPHVGRFYIRRVFRIYPLWLAVLFLTVLLHLPISPVFAPSFGFHAPAVKELIANVFLVCNLWFGPSVVGASWTLPIEVQMYLFLPFLFLFARSVRAIWPLLAIDLFAMIFARQTLPSINSTLPMCIPYFIPGVIAYVLSKRTTLKTVPAWLFPLFLFVLIAVNHVFGSFRRSWVLCLLLGLAIPLFRDMTWTPIRVISHTIAKYSYGIYLTHIMAIAFSLYTLRNYSVALRTAGFLVGFCLLPVAFYHLIEEPMIRLGARLSRHIEQGPGPRINQATLDLEPAP